MSESQSTIAAAPETEPPGAPPPGLFDRALENLRARWRDIAASARTAVGAAPRPHLPREDAERLRTQMQACLEARGGEVSARARAAQLGRAYLALDAQGRRNFLMILARDFDVDREAVDEAVDTFRAATDPVERGRAERALRRALEPPRLRLLTQFNALPEGVKFLVDLRAELIEMADGEPLLRALEDDLKSLLRAWFDVGFLEMHRITWDSPASLLEKLIKYEAVHEIRGWQDLKDRLDSDRRCFAFFHPRMPNEPLIFVEVALVQGMSDNVQTLLDPEAPVVDPKAADTAIFYSISNAQKGLAGISFGNFLIKRVVDGLAGEFPNLKTFATLSPIPGFRRWLERRMAEQGDRLLAPAERDRIAEWLDLAESVIPGRGILESALGREAWWRHESLSKALRGPLARLCAIYLTDVRPGDGAGVRARDPVAHFHLSNGARMERLNWLADTSSKGIAQSCGMMINYRYKLGEIEANHESYTGEGKVNASSALRSLLKGP
ncbi:malonyl-CoA decarboxylase [Azospirillum sp.]|uniref:malonyl-CoA decarboxylase n=1 Tax=Azospirillum sp. TaxID=34012 RepID=UPI002D5BDDDF|nr:malonyl-CoA decarboxylase [Azospirillum sp.]HYD66737.1 malonyl-CoA decarboxylase [Azospirillum sp.]